MTFSEDQIKTYLEFKAIRDEGDMNMASPMVADMLGVTRDEHLFIVKNFQALKAQHEGTTA